MLKHSIEVGQKFGKWTVKELPERVINRSKCLCACDCGKEKLVNIGNLRQGLSNSCGCGPITIHGMCDTPEYSAWRGIYNRCYNPNNEGYHRYGGRGIKMADSWYLSFQAFYDDMGERPSPAHSVERKDNDGDYCKDNCTWATAYEQAVNRSTNRNYTVFGITMCEMQWADAMGISFNTIKGRLDRGYLLEDAVLTPVNGRGPWGELRYYREKLAGVL